MVGSFLTSFRAERDLCCYGSNDGGRGDVNPVITTCLHAGCLIIHTTIAVLLGVSVAVR